jgi:hypothetical protein
MRRDDFRNYVKQFGKNWSINNSIGKKNIDEEIEKLFEEVKDGFVSDFRTQIRMMKMTDEDKKLLDNCVLDLVEEWLIQNQSNYCIETASPPYQITFKFGAWK